MDNLITLSEQSADSLEETPIDEKKFVEFMRECPILNFFKMSQSNYISKPHEEKARLITEYYKSMSQGKKDMFCLFFCLFCL